MRFSGDGEKWGGFVESTGPRYSRLGASVVVHVAFFAAIIFLARLVRPIHPQTVTYTLVRLNTRPVYTRSKPNTSQSSNRAELMRRQQQLRRQQFLSHQLREQIPDAPRYTGSDAVLQEQSERWTTDITKSLNFHGVYLNHVYQLAVQISGDPLVVSPDELPPHFQSYVIIEVTIDENGHAVHVHTVAGVVTPAIEQRLISTIRTTYRYIPAKRDGLPIPSQRNIVVHIPS